MAGEDKNNQKNNNNNGNNTGGISFDNNPRHMTT